MFHRLEPTELEGNEEGRGSPAPGPAEILEWLSDPVVVLDREWRFVYVNRRAAEAIGKPKADLMGRSIVEVSPPEASAELRQVCEQVWAAGHPAAYERYSEFFGRWVENHICPFPGGICIQWRDIGERMRAAEALQDSEKRYRELFDSMQEAFLLGEVICDEANKPADYRYLEVNPAWEEMAGKTRADVLGRTYREVSTGPWSDFWVARMGAVALTGEPAHVENWGNRGRYYEGSIYRPRPGQFAAIFVDATERKRAEERLLRSEREFRELADAMPQLVWIADPGGAVIFVNRQWEEQTGLSAEATMGFGWVDILHPEDRSRAERSWIGCVGGGAVFRAECRIRTKGGGYRWFLLRAVPIRDEQGQVVRWYATSTDIDETKRAEERLRQSQKLESVGLLAGGVAHDFNNLLTGILGNASLVVDEVAPGPAARIREVISNAERAAHLTRQLLAYAGKGQLVVRDVDIARAVNDMADLARSSIPRSVDLSISAQQRLPLVRMDPGQMQQILINLVINAGEAIGEGNAGRVGISISLAEVAEGFTDAVGEEVAPGRYVAIEVADTGSGMDEETKAKIFDPFFTTRFTGRGLGLAAVAGIIRTQKGAITLESEPGHGSTFRVLLPIGERPPEAAEPESGGGLGTILVVEDEPPVREFIAAVLRKYGYRVLVAPDGREALAIWERERQSIQALVVDIVMPVMGGAELLDRIECTEPGVRVLLTSGYSESETRRLCAGYPETRFLQKPYTARQIAEAVEQLLHH